MKYAHDGIAPEIDEEVIEKCKQIIEAAKASQKNQVTMLESQVTNFRQMSGGAPGEQNPMAMMMMLMNQMNNGGGAPGGMNPMMNMMGGMNPMMGMMGGGAQVKTEGQNQDNQQNGMNPMMGQMNGMMGGMNPMMGQMMNMMGG